ncbi:MAG: cytochrome c [Planctomycetaceae bacterium]|nr:cytochrome c [Planctomycetaceae bacterium]
MNSSRLTLFLGVMLVLSLALNAALHTDETRPNWEFLAEMKRSPASQAFETTDQFANGRTQQTPVVGTIPRGLPPLHFTASKEDAVRAGEELHNPHSESPPDPSDADPAQAAAAVKQRLAASVDRGQAVYRVYCQSCHGATGAGDGPVAQRGFPPPPPLPTGKSTQMRDGQLFHILTWGQGSMSSMAAQLDREQRWDVINYVRSLQAQAAAGPPAPASDSTSATPVPPTTQP